MTPRVLVAGIGNVFRGDDGFGVEVVRRLAGADLPAGVRVEDFGIRGVHLAYELTNGYDVALLVDATPRGGRPGTLYVIDPGDPAAAPPSDGAPLMDAHDMTPEAVLALVAVLGGQVGRVRVVGCEPDVVDERMGLSEPVSRSVKAAVRVVRDLAQQALNAPADASGAGRAATGGP